MAKVWHQTQCARCVARSRISGSPNKINDSLVNRVTAFWSHSSKWPRNPGSADVNVTPPALILIRLPVLWRKGIYSAQNLLLYSGASYVPSAYAGSTRRRVHCAGSRIMPNGFGGSQGFQGRQSVRLAAQYIQIGMVLRMLRLGQMFHYTTTTT